MNEVCPIFLVCFKHVSIVIFHIPYILCVRKYVFTICNNIYKSRILSEFGVQSLPLFLIWTGVPVTDLAAGRS